MLDRRGEDLAERAKRTAAVIDVFRNKPFDWKTRGNCIHLWRAQLTAMGHAVPPVPRFRSPRGARTALRHTGHETLEGLVTAYLPRIPASRVLVGDVVLLPGSEGALGLGALAVALGGSRLIGWHGRDLSRLLPFDVTGREIIAAWAVGLKLTPDEVEAREIRIAEAIEREASAEG